MEFRDLGLSDFLIEAIEKAGYTIPTPIQQAAIPQILRGRDVLGYAPTGTGKTASFTLPMLEILHNGRAKGRMPRSLILSPTRELAMQISENFKKYGANSGLTMALLIGGVGFEDQERLLDRGVDVLIATPGRMLDHFSKGKFLLNDVKVFVIDEADRMLDMGFIPDIEKIASLLPTMRQTLMFSATMPKEIQKLAEKFMINPKEVQVERPASTAVTVDQFVVPSPNDTKAKRDILRQVLESEKPKNAFVFCNRKKDVDILSKSMIKHGFKAGALHGDMEQEERNKVFAQFKAQEIDYLICSDVAARGLDVVDVSHVINFDVPFQSEDYVHRIGRTGRAGKTGRAIMLVSDEEEKSLSAIQRLIDKAIPQLTVNGDPIVARVFEDRGDRRGGRHQGRNRHSGGRNNRFNNRRDDNRPARFENREDRPREERPQQEKSYQEKPRQERQHQKPRDQHQPRHESRHAKDDAPAPKGMGGHVPAFLAKRASA